MPPVTPRRTRAIPTLCRLAGKETVRSSAGAQAREALSRHVPQDSSVSGVPNLQGSGAPIHEKESVVEGVPVRVPIATNRVDDSAAPIKCEDRLIRLSSGLRIHAAAVGDQPAAQPLEGARPWVERLHLPATRIEDPEAERSK